MLLRASVLEGSKHMTKEAALQLITSHAMYTPLHMDKETVRVKSASLQLMFLKMICFRTAKLWTQKIYFLGYMCNKLRTSIGWEETDDRDSYLNKRLDLSGVLLNNLFRNYFNKLVKDMQKQVVREINNGSWRSTDDYGKYY